MLLGQAVEIYRPLSCRGLTAISRIACVKSTAQRESLYRYKCVSELLLASPLVSPSLLSPIFISSSIHPPSLFPPSFLSGCQTIFCCHVNDWYSNDLKDCSRSRHLYSCCCCYHWYPTYHIWLLLPCTAGGALLPWLPIFSQSFSGYM